MGSPPKKDTGLFYIFFCHKKALVILTFGSGGALFVGRILFFLFCVFSGYWRLKREGYTYLGKVFAYTTALGLEGVFLAWPRAFQEEKGAGMA
jgi:hypothetical protein